MAKVVISEFCDGYASPLWRRQRSHQNEFKECSENSCWRWLTFPNGCNLDGLKERSEGRRVLCRRSSSFGDRLRRRTVVNGRGARNHCDCPHHFLNEDIGKSKKKAPLRSVLSKSSAINRLSIARFFLFGSRDIWFVVALPVFLSDELGWSERGVGGFLALWVIGYGVVQSFAPKMLARGGRLVDEVSASRQWALILSFISAVIALLVAFDIAVHWTIVGGLVVFGVAFAMNSSLHSYLVLAFSQDDSVALDVGFYYSANAAGRFVGTLLSGLLYLWGDLVAALWGSAIFVVITWICTRRLPPLPDNVSISIADVEGSD